MGNMSLTDEYGTHTIKSHGSMLARYHMQDWLMLPLLLLVIGGLNYIEPFHRYVGKDMMTDLTFPFKEDTIPMWAVPVYAILFPCLIFFLYYMSRRDVYDLHHAVLGLLFSVLITGVITDSIKDAVGRPRPNFFWRCFSDGMPVFNPSDMDVMCTNTNLKVIKEGYKSFPSGHTSWSFAGLGFLSLYLSGKIRAFDHRGNVVKVCIVIMPYLMAILVGVSRVSDYWHHWTDVFAGAIIGTIISSLCYLHFFPLPHRTNGWAPHAYFGMLADANSVRNPATDMQTAPYMHYRFDEETG
ncbi:lipid phosphate phosphatase 2-like [Diospyros lotus]|uniref:lipid phosphate phosphatase 2-like n=1 Tax=Diospyros lotus TaxID=55363 RepID=UPI002259734C|nr:lipid phosphate phosphatase 2-like [Diospyros lotus]